MIKQNQFEAFLKVRDSGVTNMFDTKRVAMEMCKLGSISFPGEVKEIISDFDELSEKFNSEE